MIICLSILYAIVAFATMVIAYHWAINYGRMEGTDEFVSVVLGIIWPITLCWVSLYMIVPLIKITEKFIYKENKK